MSRLHTQAIPHARKYLAVAITAIALSPSLQAEDLALEEVVVTAQKRSQNLQDVPISISASTEEFIEQVGAQSVNDLGIYTPGLETNNTQVTQPSITIRGIGIGGFDITKDPAVAVYVDGVYVRTGAAMNAFNDVERVEILKGPQGTLFGRNAAAGAVHVISKAPSSETEGKVELGVGSYGKTKITGMYNTALSDNVFLRMNVLDNKRDGYAENLTTGKKDIGEENNSAARATLLWDFSDTTTVTFRAEHVDIDQNSNTSASVNPLISHADPYGDVENDAPKKETLELGAGSVTVESDLGAATFTSITSSRSFKSYNRTDDDGSGNINAYLSTANEEENDTFSQEFRLTSNDSPVKWTTGVMYSREEASQTHNVNSSVELAAQALAANGASWDNFFGPGGFETAKGIGDFINEQVTTDLTSISQAIYGEVTYPATDRLNATAGLRYTKDNKEVIYTHLDSNFASLNPAFSPHLNIAFPDVDIVENHKRDDSWGKLTKRSVLDYSLDDDSMIYGSYSEGYKSGGFDAFKPNESSFDAENVVNYELGLKSSHFDNRLRLNTSLFKYEYTDLQNLALVKNEGSQVATYQNRSTDSEGYGLELEAVWRATQNLTLSGNYSYLKTEYTKYQLLGTETSEKDLTGKPQSGVPEHKYNIAANYVLPLSADIGELEFNLAYTYVGERSTSAETQQDPALESMYAKWRDDLSDSYQLVNARITYYDPSSQWKVSLYGHNLTNEKYLVELGGVGKDLGLLTATRNSPRMYGLDVSYTF